MKIPYDDIERDRNLIEALARAIFDAEEDFYSDEPGSEPRGERHFKVARTYYYALAHGALTHLHKYKLLREGTASSILRD